MVRKLEDNLRRDFLLWSLGVKSDKMNEIRENKILENACQNFWLSLKNGLQRAFHIWKYANISKKIEDATQANDNQILDLDTRSKLGKVCQNFTLSLKNGLSRAFYIWKLANQAKKFNDELLKKKM